MDIDSVPSVIACIYKLIRATPGREFIMKTGCVLKTIVFFMKNRRTNVEECPKPRNRTQLLTPAPASELSTGATVIRNGQHAGEKTRLRDNLKTVTASGDSEPTQMKHMRDTWRINTNAQRDRGSLLPIRP